MLSREQHVVGLDVAVNDPVSVRVGKRVADVAQYDGGLFDRQRAIVREAISQRPSLFIGHHVVRSAVHLARIVERHDVRMTQLRCDLDLAKKPRLAEPRGELRPHDFDCHVTRVPDVAGQEHGGHPALPDTANHAIPDGDRVGECVNAVVEQLGEAFGCGPLEEAVRPIILGCQPFELRPRGGIAFAHLRYDRIPLNRSSIEHYIEECLEPVPFVRRQRMGHRITGVKRVVGLPGRNMGAQSE